MDIIDSVFEGNLASDQDSWISGGSFKQGGALAVFGEAEVALRSASFFENGAEHGGAVVMRGNLTVQVEDCLFEDNIANSYGGAVTLTVRAANFDRWVGWLVGEFVVLWLVGWLVSWLVGGWVGWLVGAWASWSVGRSVVGR